MSHIRTAAQGALKKPTSAQNAPSSGVRFTIAVDESTRRLVDQHVKRAALKLSSEQFALLCEVAPYALAMAGRIRRSRDRSDQPANVFVFRAVRNKTNRVSCQILTCIMVRK